jgi:hypothetical protein
MKEVPAVMIVTQVFCLTPPQPSPDIGEGEGREPEQVCC